MKFILGNDLRGFNSVCMKTLTVLRDTVRLIDIPLAKFTRNFIPITDCGCKRNSHREIGSYFHVMLAMVFSFGFILVLLVVYFPAMITSTFADSPRLVTAMRRILPLFLTKVAVFNLRHTYRGVFMTLNRTQVSVFVTLLHGIVLLIPLTLILPHFYNIRNMFVTRTISSTATTVYYALLFF